MPSELAQRIWTYGTSRGLLHDGDRILIAVSGGPDSMALLEILRELSRAHHLALHVAHVHHMLRSGEADADLSFVKRYARFVGIPCSTVRVNVPARRRTTHESLEEAARHMRYDALDRIRRRTRMRVIATGHHADDQVETLFMRAMRGTDVQGLAGIRTVLRSPPTIRPLLPATRREIVSYLRDSRIPYREDSTNKDLSLTRNRVRAALATGSGSIVRKHFYDSLPRLAEAAQSFGGHLNEFTAGLLDLGTASDGHLELPETMLRQLLPHVRASVIAEALRRVNVPVSRDRVDRILTLLSLPAGKRVMFRSAGAMVLHDSHRLVFGKTRSVRRSVNRLRPGASLRGFGYTIRASRPRPSPRKFSRDANIAWVDLDSAGKELLVRPWKHGDRFFPLGMGGKSKKVSDTLRDARIPLYYRETAPVVLSGKRIVWVCGVRPDERFRITEKTRRAIQLSYHPSV